jgi:hypothetical protein
MEVALHTAFTATSRLAPLRPALAPLTPAPHDVR